MRRAIASCAAVAAFAGGCFGAAVQQRTYYVINANPQAPGKRMPIEGLVRVRNLDVASAYDKFQIVVRRSPYELRYAQSDVWAVKPNQMLSDVMARALADTRTFDAVVRAIGETRPMYVVDGDLQAIEIYDSDDIWFAHLSLTLRLSRFDTGAVVWSYGFDERKPVPTRTYSHAVRAISELFTLALERAIVTLEPLRASEDDAVPEAPAEVPATGN